MRAPTAAEYEMLEKLKQTADALPKQRNSQMGTTVRSVATKVHLGDLEGAILVTKGGTKIAIGTSFVKSSNYMTVDPAWLSQTPSRTGMSFGQQVDEIGEKYREASMTAMLSFI
jgi:hypothetical protein